MSEREIQCPHCEATGSSLSLEFANNHFQFCKKWTMKMSIAKEQHPVSKFMDTIENHLTDLSSDERDFIHALANELYNKAHRQGQEPTQTEGEG